MTLLDQSKLNTLQIEGGNARRLYAQVADFLSDMIERDFADGDQFFTEKILIDRLPVSQVTIRRAMMELTNQGLIERMRRRGTVVRKRKPALSQPLVRAASTAALTGTAPKRSTQTDRPLRAIGIFRPAHMVPLSEHGTELMAEFRNQCDARRIECRFYDASNADSMLRSFAAIHSAPDEEAFVLHTPYEATMMLYHSLANRGFRTVAMEGASASYPGCVVETDAAEAARIGVNYLHELGHRRIVLLVNEPASEPTVSEKVDAFQAETALLGIWRDCRVVVCERSHGDSYEAAFNHMAEAMDSSTGLRPTAIMTVSDPGAWAALKWCSQNQIGVPNDLSVLGFEDTRSSKYMIPALSSIAHPREQLVSKVLDVLKAKNAEPAGRILIPPVLMKRESAGPAPISDLRETAHNKPTNIRRDEQSPREAAIASH